MSTQSKSLSPLTPEDLVARMRVMADEIMEPLLCTQPAYGAPGYAHCAACCYGKGYIVTCEEDQAFVDAAFALNRAADFLDPRPVAELLAKHYTRAAT